ncbi:AraC family transcriptional regulator [Actinoplanes sp. M2I2]|uniref:helix-turn-helix transcriptional regulator n=1 Tax=Actinoplanes sp. M2I2 TaxID=1734444 RepID=UPI0020225E3C|nr:AraC family transcriptional regulator [Actinoplanes sp. M2I2]
MSNPGTGAFTLDLRRGGEGRSFVDQWQTHVGAEFALPAFSPATSADFRFRFEATRVQDVAITGIDGVSAARTSGPAADGDEYVRLWVVRQGEWALGSSRGESERRIPAGRFLMQHAGRMTHFALPPHTTAQVFMLPAAELAASLKGRAVSGDAGTAEVRLLLAHAAMVGQTLSDLGPAGVKAARDTLIELAHAVTLRGFDGTDPRLVPALVRSAKELAVRQLHDAELSPSTLARDLNVSVRTLHRAFAATGETVMAYIRDQRLEQAHRALVASAGRLTVAEAAARWQFADSSHFIRHFKRRYGRTPTEPPLRP